MTTLTFAQPVLLADHFDVPADTTPWLAAGTSAAYVKTNPGMTPARYRASFKTLSHAMVPVSAYGKNLSKTYGLYVLAFGGAKDLTPWIYVGTTVRESVLARIRKHRVKATGSHIGRGANVSGGVNHTSGWRPFAERRYIEHAGRHDLYTDVRLVVGQLNLPNVDDTKLRQFEASLCSNQHGVLDQIKSMLWSVGVAKDVSLLTGRHDKALANSGMRILFWDGQMSVFP
ncbi:TPA: hypothetical protein ACKR04_002108 [Pseudomonas aeruginosa]